MSSLYYFTSVIHPVHFDIKTNRELVAHVLFPLLQFWRCAPEEDIQAQNQGGDTSWAGRMSRELYHDEDTLPLRRLKNSLPGNTIKTCSYSQYLLIIGKAPVTIRFSSSLVGLQK